MTARVVFTGTTHNTSGRNGGTRSNDGLLDLKLAEPHPAAENLFGAAWSACYMGAIQLAAAQRKIKLPS
ncbi:MAG: peroxiredoxin, partial [Pseudorhodoplanes sp.]